MIRKSNLIVTALLAVSSVFAQTPEKMNFQAVVRNSEATLVTEQAVGMQISILQGAADGTAVYTETQTPTTNINGLLTIEVGTGTTTGDFTTINWAEGPYFIKTEIDPAGAEDYTITGTTQLLSVPYALQAKKTAGIGVYTATELAALNPTLGYIAYNSTDAKLQVYDGSAWIIIGASEGTDPIDPVIRENGADFTAENIIMIAEKTAAKGAMPAEISDDTNKNGTRNIHYANGVIYSASKSEGKVWYWNKSDVDAVNNLAWIGLGGTFGVSSVYAVDEHVYVSNMTMAEDQVFKVAYYATKDATPTVAVEYTIPAGVRLGDAISVVLDDNGDGMLYATNYKKMNIYAFAVTAYATISSTPTIITISNAGDITDPGAYARVNKAESGELLFSGANIGLLVMDAAGVVSATVATDVIPARAQDIRVFNYAGKRYLLYAYHKEGGGSESKIQMINITDGITLADALAGLNATNVADKVVYTYVLGTVTDWATVSCTSAYEKVGDKLEIFGFSLANGYTLQEFSAAE